MVGRDEAVGEVMSMVYCGSGNAPFLFYAGGEVVGMQVLDTEKNMWGVKGDVSSFPFFKNL
jgi:hypothetical protein